MEWDGISLFSPADTLELFVIRAEKSSQAAETYGEKKRPRSRIKGFLMQKMEYFQHKSTYFNIISTEIGWF